MWIAAWIGVQLTLMHFDEMIDGETSRDERKGTLRSMTM
jgi:hypothetical protein